MSTEIDCFLGHSTLSAHIYIHMHACASGYSWQYMPYANM